MASTADIAKGYFIALTDHDLDRAVACFAPGAVDRLAGQEDLVAPDGIRAYYSAMFGAFPDFGFEILDTTAYRNRCAVRWRVRATFAGPGRFQGFAANGERIDVEGCDVATVADGLITHNDAYFDSRAIARQLGLLPPAGSRAEQRLTKLANAVTRTRELIHGAEAEAIAPGVWVVRGGRPKLMNVYLLADEGGLTVFDAGISDMGTALRAACAQIAPVKRVVLGHADCDHRGAANALGVPVYCHPADRAAAQSPSSSRDYWDLTRLSSWARPGYPKLMERWDGGAVPIEGTVEEGDEIAGFKVVHLPGHAPGLIGLFREEDRLSLVSDCIYTLNPETGVKGVARVPHPAFNQDTDQARASIRKLAELDPAAVWAGHARPVVGDVAAHLERAASASI
jgi:steroid delta-isomerase-like uncharacterized protein